MFALGCGGGRCQWFSWSADLAFVWYDNPIAGGFDLTSKSRYVDAWLNQYRHCSVATDIFVDYDFGCFNTAVNRVLSKGRLVLVDFGLGCIGSGYLGNSRMC